MRTNLPVTENEYLLADDTLIVSKTDTRGRLTYFNDQFVQAAGFTEAELIGQPHNIVRHPDMPPEAFEDLWKTFKAGQPWSGAVKNRRKDGGYYWVLASATPIWEDGSITGYMSIRTRLPRDQRAEAEHVYELIRKGKAQNYRIDAGIIRHRSLVDRFGIFTRTLKIRLVTLIACMAVFMLMVGIAGISRDFSAGWMGTLAILAFGLGIGGLLGAATIRAVSRPIAQLNDVMANIAQGRFNSRILIERDDELGIALRSLQALQAKLGFEREEQKDIEKRNAAQRRRDMTQLAGEFEQAVGAIVTTVSTAAADLETSTLTLTRTADTTQQRANAVASASEEASTNVQAVAASTEEMNSTISEINRQVQASSQIAGEAVDQANETDARIARLSEVATRIGDVTEIIAKIASQTNLLALNATIEAARAGETGRGFAVVASEVKLLAVQTAKATSEISSQISAMQQATHDSVIAIKKIGSTIGKVSGISATIAVAVEQQGMATQEISRNIQQVAEGTAEVAVNVTAVNRGAAETGAASSHALVSAQLLAGESVRLKREMDGFLAKVRAG